MKKIIFFVVIILFGLSVNVAFAQLVSPYQGIGGRIITAPTPGIVCPAGKPGSPFTIAPSGPSPAGPFVGDYYPVSNFHLLVSSAWFLGLGSIVPLPECFVPVPPPGVPVPVNGFRTILHGTSVQVNG